MSISYNPQVGESLWCDFGGIEPEMVKRRLVVVISPKSIARWNLATVVPISTTAPPNIKAWHYQMERDPLPGSSKVVWAKCDMVSVVCFERLGGYYRRWNGKREYKTLMASMNDVIGIRKGLLAGLGFGNLIPHL